MTQIRLLPIVIVAALALLLLKGIGLVTEGGYVLVGTTAAVAAGGPAPSGGEATLSLPVEPTLEDTSPTIDDGAVTLPLGEANGGHGAGADAAHEDSGASEAAAAETAESTAAPVIAPPGVCPPEGAVLPEGAPPPAPDCVRSPLNAAGDAIPLIKDDAGHMVPLTESGGSESALLERLNERRTDLDTREAELAMRMALVEAAEKRIEERTAALEALEVRINAMVDEKRTLEEAQFTSVVAMYETMKPKDAAAIFDQLDMSVLLRVARAINPRKMAPIMARMAPERARDLTARLAVDQVEPTIEVGSQDLSALPQIIGQ